MDLNWSPDDSSSFIQWDEFEAGPSSVAQNAPEGELVPSNRQNGLLGIDDSDFRALIEILGTDGDRDKVRRNTGTGAFDERRLIQNNEQRGQRDRAAPAAAQDERNSDENGPSGSENRAPRALPSASPELNRPSATSRVPEEAAIPQNPALSSPARRPKSGTEGPLSQQPARSLERTSSPGPSRTAGRPNLHQATTSKLKPNAGFTQSKQYLGSSIEDVKGQVADLRTRLQVLKDEVKEFAPHLHRRAFDTLETQTRPGPFGNRRAPEDERQVETNGKGKGKAVQWSNSVNSNRRSRDDIIASLTEDEAKNALANICRTLSLDPSTLTSAQPSGSHIPDPPSTLADILRALRLVSDLDELVWRNTNRRDLEAYNIYDEDNIQSILDRVRLWERTARSRTGRRPGP